MKSIKSLLTALLLTSVCHAEQKVLIYTDVIKAQEEINLKLESGVWRIQSVSIGASLSHGAALYGSCEINILTKNNIIVFVLDRVEIKPKNHD